MKVGAGTSVLGKDSLLNHGLMMCVTINFTSLEIYVPLDYLAPLLCFQANL